MADTVIRGGSVSEIAQSVGTFERLDLDPAGNIMFFPDDNMLIYHHPSGLYRGQEIQDKPLLNKLVPDNEEPPQAVWTTTPLEGIRDSSEPIVLSTTPDVAKTPRGSSTPPIPYSTSANPADDLSYTPSVRMTGMKTMVLRSDITVTKGAEQGTAKGVVSGTINDITEPRGHSATVNAEGSPIIRHFDPFYMNNKNNHGEVTFIKSTEIVTPENGDKAADTENDEDEGFFTNLWAKASDATSEAIGAIAEFDNNYGNVLTRGMGVLQAVGGAGEAVLGAAIAGAGGAATSTGIGAAPGVPAMIGGGALFVNGWDNVITGAKTAVYGDFQNTMASELAGSAASALGASPQAVETVKNSVDLASGAALLAGGLVAATRKSGKQLVETASKQADGLVDDVAKQTDEVLEEVTEETGEAAAKNADEVQKATPDNSVRVSSQPPTLRLAYEKEVKELALKAKKMRDEGYSSEEIARALNSDRRNLGIKYKDITPEPLRSEIFERNMKKYNDKWGPTIDYLRGVKEYSWEQIIEKSSKPGGRDINFNRKN
ncbi:DUF4150 domain-containing protein [Flexibacterium corallicola]|uniref:DUF4150 domain-containing protein n=1 Tax=Flexibacterium corallicola TaxID=3037259 RepID=UPI00286ECCC3|nr:DUF4150 domain-containing protein [Pseudovibrio sp. M1P-2-3]